MKPMLRRLWEGAPTTLRFGRRWRQTSLLACSGPPCSLLTQRCACSTNGSDSRVHLAEQSGEKKATEGQPSAPPPNENTLDDLLMEIQIVLNRPLQIGALFRSLSSASRRTLVKNKVPLEQLLLRYPDNFAVYRQKQGRNATITCAPLHLVPANVCRMFLETPPTAASTNSSNDINARVLQDDPIMQRQQKIHTVLQYIPNEWSPFTELGIPEEVRVKCMGKPGIKANEFFQKYPQYFEVRQQGLSEHTFHVRRSLALQRKMEKGL